MSPHPFAGTRRHHDLEPYFQRLWLVGERGTEILEDARVRLDVIRCGDESNMDRMCKALHLQRARHLLSDVINVGLHYRFSVRNAARRATRQKATIRASPPLGTKHKVLSRSGSRGISFRVPNAQR